MGGVGSGGWGGWDEAASESWVLGGVVWGD